MSMEVIDPVTGAPTAVRGANGRVTSRPPNAIAITPDPVKTYDPPIEVYVGGAGNVAVVPYGRAGDASVIFTAAPAGSILPLLCKQVLAAGTTATQLIGSW